MGGGQLKAPFSLSEDSGKSDPPHLQESVSNSPISLNKTKSDNDPASFSPVSFSAAGYLALRFCGAKISSNSSFNNGRELKQLERMFS
jgi:hypothetical protein